MTRVIQVQRMRSCRYQRRRRDSGQLYGLMRYHRTSHTGWLRQRGPGLGWMPRHLDSIFLILVGRETSDCCSGGTFTPFCFS